MHALSFAVLPARRQAREIVGASGCAERFTAAAALIAVLAGAPQAARAQSRAALPKMPEPLVGESITDIDGVEAGELEIDLTASALRAKGGGRAPWNGSVEAEWRAHRLLGLALEVGLGGSLGAVGSEAVASSIRSAASLSFLHVPALDLHLMADASLRLSTSGEGVLRGEAEPGDQALPLAFNLRGGMRRGLVTARGALGIGAGGDSAHRLPLRAEGAIYLGLGVDGRWGFAGMEADTDFGRRTPLVFAPQFVLDGAAAGAPFRLGIAVPFVPGAARGEPSLGLLIRIIWEPEGREPAGEGKTDRRRMTGP